MDFYTALAAEALKKPFEEVTEAERLRAKKWWYSAMYNGPNLSYVNTFVLSKQSDAYTLMAAITYKHSDGRNKLPRSSGDLLTVVYDFDNPHDAYISLCEAYSSGVPLVSAGCCTELPQ